MQRILQHVKPERRNKELEHNPTHALFWQRSFHVETFEQLISPLIPFIVPILKLSGLYRRGVRNALHIHTTELTVFDAALPPSFDGFTLLFLSDLHLDGNDALIQPLTAALDTLKADICLLGGDYRALVHGPILKVMECFHQLVPHIHTREGIVGILGNHDTWEMIRPLEQLGIIMLINESLSLQRGDDRIWILGLDDPHYYKCDDYPKANQNIPDTGFRIVLAHSSGTLPSIAKEPVNLYLCGHTHAGQISLPVWGPVITHSKLRGPYVYGRWKYNHIKGYTTSGSGTSGIPVRYNTRSELVLMTLKRG